MCVPKMKLKMGKLAQKINTDALISLLIMMLKPRLKQAYDLIWMLVRPYLLNSSWQTCGSRPALGAPNMWSGSFELSADESERSQFPESMKASCCALSIAIAKVQCLRIITALILLSTSTWPRLGAGNSRGSPRKKSAHYILFIHIRLHR